MHLHVSLVFRHPTISDGKPFNLPSTGLPTAVIQVGVRLLGTIPAPWSQADGRSEMGLTSTTSN